MRYTPKGHSPYALLPAGIIASSCLFAFPFAARKDYFDGFRFSPPGFWLPDGLIGSTLT